MNIFKLNHSLNNITANYKTLATREDQKLTRRKKYDEWFPDQPCGMVAYFGSAYKLSKDVGIPQTRVSEIIKRNRRVTADTALRLSKYFGNSAKFWLGLQDDFDIEEEEHLKSKELELIEHYQSSAA